jgi:hypothetical protein
MALKRRRQEAKILPTASPARLTAAAALPRARKTAWRRHWTV